MLTKRYRSKKLNKRNKRNKTRKTQRGGVGFKYEVGACPIGGRPPVVATSDCPGVGPGSADFANALYGLNSAQVGGKRKKLSKSKRNLMKRNKLKKHK
jgi:hypothetical protein